MERLQTVLCDLLDSYATLNAPDREPVSSWETCYRPRLPFERRGESLRTFYEQ